MPYIEIKEQDLTSPSGASDNTDIVYIPGFVETNREINPNLYKDNGLGDYIGLEPNKPTLFTSLAQFENMCGKQGVVFEEDQRFTDLASSGGFGSTFDEEAIPFDGVMFYAGSEDPAYVMAKELLIAGLPVLFERVNKDPELKEIKFKSEPSDWSSTYQNYYKKIDTYVPIVSRTVPTFGLVKAASTKWDQGTNYYKIKKDDTTNESPEYLYFEKVSSESVTRDQTTTLITDPDAYIYNEAENANYASFEAKQTKEDSSTEDFVYSNLTGDHKIAKPKSETISSKTIVNTVVVKKSELGNITLTEGEAADYTVDTSSGTITLSVALVAGESISVKYIFPASPSFSGEDRYERTADGYVKYEEEPEDWNTAGFTYYEKVQAADKFISSDGTGYKIDSSWITEYPKYTVKSETYISLADEDNPTFEQEANYYKTVSGKTIVDMYTALQTVYATTQYSSGLDDKGNYSIKYLTSGGYPVYEYADGKLVNAMLSLAEVRGDCVALIDHTDNVLRETNPDRPESIIYKIRELPGVSGSAAVDPYSYGAMFTPWAEYTRVSSEKDINDTALDPNQNTSKINLTTIRLPASFAYLSALATSIKTYPNWLAIAGVTRGIVSNLATNGMTTVIPNGVADYMVSEKPDQKYMSVRAINPITNINPYGETIWGNRTLASNKDGVKATSFLNIRNLVSDVKKLVYRTCRRMTYEPNSEQLWVNIQAAITPTLDRMKSGMGISGYQLALNKNHERFGEKATLCFKIILYPVYPVEVFYVDIVLKDDEISISE